MTINQHGKHPKTNRNSKTYISYSSNGINMNNKIIEKDKALEKCKKERIHMNQQLIEKDKVLKKCKK